MLATYIFAGHVPALHVLAESCEALACRKPALVSEPAPSLPPVRAGPERRKLKIKDPARYSWQPKEVRPMRCIPCWRANTRATRAHTHAQGCWFVRSWLYRPFDPLWVRRLPTQKLDCASSGAARLPRLCRRKSQGWEVTDGKPAARLRRCWRRSRPSTCTWAARTPAARSRARSWTTSAATAGTCSPRPRRWPPCLCKLDCQPNQIPGRCCGTC